jgi:hypothetical protein
MVAIERHGEHKMLLISCENMEEEGYTVADYLIPGSDIVLEEIGIVDIEPDFSDVYLDNRYVSD